ncbi:hypothetical protein PISL3812_02252 [Talaromyces islandicus]|uniref:Pre-mRNA splicing factor CLF1 n=1 Tax=Talaromyces islandicus TaxID=28573 RepID=A0A0U1LPE0_TALIS|nr:hypothetical protein PISL3812_02252 [Talaromyces islandicus]
MTSPKPPSSLDGHCSVVHDNALYVYTPSTLMTLPLEKGGNWTTLDMGQSVTGAACVKGSADGDPNHQAMFIVGGTSDNKTYSGLQRYSFVNEKWESITLPSQQIQNRVNHSAIYLSGSSSILVYAGSADSNEDASTSTFEITTAGPSFGIENRDSNGAPAAIKPTLLPWDNTTAVYVGGMSTNTEVFLYRAGSGWQTSGVSLAAGIPSDAGVAMQSNSDGSKFLEIFDMTSSPNNVSYVALSQSGGNLAWPGEPVTFGSSSSTAGAQKRDWGNLPAYDSTFAPSTPRTGFSIAQSDNGLVVISGGSEKDPVTLFNQAKNSWVDTTAFFGSQKNGAIQQPLGTTTTSAASTATATSTATSTTASATSAIASASSTATPSSDSGGSSTGLIIGATLGALGGLAILLIILLLILRRLHRKKDLTEKGGRRSGADDKDRLSFQDQGIEPLTQSAVPMARSQGPSAVDSIYMISGKFADDNPSATPMVKTNNSNISRPLIPQNNGTPTNEPQNPTATRFLNPNQARGDRSTNAGWSKYFQDTSATDVMNSHRNTFSSDISQESRSDYGSDAWPHISEKGTGLQEPRPLGLPSHSPSNERLPTVGRGYAHHGHTAKISSADSASSVSDEDYEHDRRDAFSSGVPASINDTLHWSHPGIRPPSSNYTESFYQSSAHNLPTMHSEPMPNDGRGSSAIFHQDTFNPPRSNINSDMSWLNIHAEK